MRQQHNKKTSEKSTSPMQHNKKTSEKSTSPMQRVQPNVSQHVSPQGIPSLTPEDAIMIPRLKLPSRQRAEASSQVNIKNHEEVRTKALAYFERRNKQEPSWLLDRYGRYLNSLNQTPRAGCDDNSRYVALMEKAVDWPELKEKLMCEVKSELTNDTNRFLLSAQGDAPDDYVCGPRDFLDEMLRKVFSPPKFTSLDDCFISEVDFNSFVMVVVDYIFHNLAEHRAMCEAGRVVHLPNAKLPAPWPQALYDPLNGVDMKKSEFGWDSGVWEPSKCVKTQNWPSEEHIRKIPFNDYELRLKCNGEQVNALEWCFNNGCVMRQVFLSPVDMKGELKYGKKTDRPAFIEILNKLFGGIPSESSASGSDSNERIGEFKKSLLSLNNESIKPVVIMSCDGAWAAHAHLGVCEFLRQNLEVLGEDFWTRFSALDLTPGDIFQILAEVKLLKCVEGAHIYELNSKQNPVSREHVISAWLSEFTSDAGKTKDVKDQVKKVIGRVLDCPFTDAENKPARKRALASLTGLLRSDVDFNEASTKPIAEHVWTLVQLLHSVKAKKSKANKRPSKQIQNCLLALCKACDEDDHAVPKIIDRYQVLCYQVRYKSRVEKLLKLVLHDGGDSNSSSAQGEGKLTYLLDALNDAGYLKVAGCLSDMLGILENKDSAGRSSEDSAGRSVAPVASCEELLDGKQVYLNRLCQACGEDESKKAEGKTIEGKTIEGKTIDQIIEMMKRRVDACSPRQQNSEARRYPNKSPTNMPSPTQVEERASMQKLMRVGSRTGLRQDSHQGVGKCSMLKPHGPYKPADHAANLHNQQCAMFSQFQYLEMLRKSENPASETQMDVAEQVLNRLLYRFQVSMRQAQAEKPVGSSTLSHCLSPPLSPAPTR